jgi:DNA-binding NarL/FixJ family response regulator
VDDHKMWCAAIGAAVEKDGLCSVVGTADNGAAGVELAAQLPELDIVLMDVGMPIMSGPEATRLILAARPKCKVIALSMYMDQQSLVSMVLAGACSYVPKTESMESLASVISSAMAGQYHFPPGVSLAIVDLIRNPDSIGGVRLTARELECLRHSASGLSIKETADIMRVSPATVRGYRKIIGRKIGATGARALREFYFANAGSGSSSGG